MDPACLSVVPVMEPPALFHNQQPLPRSTGLQTQQPRAFSLCTNLGRCPKMSSVAKPPGASPTPAMSPSPHSNPATSVSYLSLRAQSPCQPGTVCLGTLPYTFEDLSLICSQVCTMQSHLPFSCALFTVHRTQALDARFHLPLLLPGEVPVSTSFEIVLNTHRPEEMAQCDGPTKPGLFLARYLANHYSESPSYRKLLDDCACLFVCLLARLS